MSVNKLADKLAAKIAAAKATGVDMTQVQQGGRDYQPPAAGSAWARLVGYFEIGKHEKEFEGRKSTPEMVQLVFELSGPNHPVSAAGIPTRITLEEALSFTSKANFPKVFAMMNYAGDAKHASELLGRAFVVEIFHKKSADGKRTFATMKGTSKTTPVGNGYSIRGTSVQDSLTGKPVSIPVPEPLTEIKAFFWNDADKEDWDSIFIDGKYDDRVDEKTKVVTPGKSKNTLQNKIMSAVNWKDHPLAAVIAAGGQVAELPDAEDPEEGEQNEGNTGTAAGSDPLAGI
jgi:hypothetical protein